MILKQYLKQVIDFIKENKTIVEQIKNASLNNEQFIYNLFYYHSNKVYKEKGLYLSDLYYEQGNDKAIFTLYNNAIKASL